MSHENTCADSWPRRMWSVALGELLSASGIGSHVSQHGRWRLSAKMGRSIWTFLGTAALLYSSAGQPNGK
jgi:hypothetical protein